MIRNTIEIILSKPQQQKKTFIHTKYNKVIDFLLNLRVLL